MRVLFLCLGNEFTAEMKYKENYLIKAAVENGDEVYVITTTKTYINGVSTNVNEGVYDGGGYTYLRIKNKNFGIPILTDKIRVTPGLKEKILSFKPDVLFYNCPQIWNVNELKAIRSQLPKCNIIWDFSTWYGNSGNNWISLNILHRGIYRFWLKKNEKYVSKIYYTADDPHRFIREVYKLDDKKMKLSDLPSEILDAQELRRKRHIFRKRENIEDDAVIFIHTGKFEEKKRTVELLKAFNNISDKYDTYLFVVGKLNEDVKEQAEELIRKNDKIRFVGFLKADDMLEIISGCDVYLQPGSTSQTFQEAICRGCIPIYAERKYDYDLVGNAGIQLHSIEELEASMEKLLKNPSEIKKMRKELSERIAQRLDYKVVYKNMINVEHDMI